MRNPRNLLTRGDGEPLVVAFCGDVLVRAKSARRATVFADAVPDLHPGVVCGGTSRVVDRREGCEREGSG
jgi:hypothetical protein